MVFENLHREVKLDYFTALYATFVTMTTVGYGDITPQHEPGQIYISFFILVIFIYFPMQLNTLLGLMAMTSPYQRDWYKQNIEIPHLIITGYI